MGTDRAKRKIHGGSLLGNDWEQKTRAKIQASQIINRLISYINGDISLESAQVSAAGLLLRKVLPDLTASDNKTEVIHRYVASVPEVAASVETWQQQHAPPTIQ